MAYQTKAITVAPDWLFDITAKEANPNVDALVVDKACSSKGWPAKRLVRRVS